MGTTQIRVRVPCRSLPERQVKNYFHYPLLSILPEFSRNEGIESVQDLDRDRITRLVLSLEGRKRKDGAPISPATRWPT